jgi:predicted transcriptional regulator
MPIRGVARRIGRDVKAAHGAVRALRGAGLLDRTEGGRVVLAYDAVHVDLMPRMA